MSDKKTARLRRARRIRSRITRQGALRLSVHRTPRHFYAQILSPDSSRVLTAAATVEAPLRKKPGGNCAAAAAVGKLLAERARKADIARVAFDRSGFRYHGRVRAFAEAAREHGLEF